ncbi:MAG: hypothetical protein M3O20_18485 [Acidobacteriota bacterium]|nr:hypothetical protein [Acidobacteriota bacterium]
MCSNLSSLQARAGRSKSVYIAVRPVEAAEEADVDTVVVDGRILKRAGKLTGLSTSRVLADASASLAAMRQRVGGKPE